MKMRLHHIGVVAKDLAGAAELYRLRFGYEPSGGVVHDPEQTAYVQFLRLPGDEVLMELVAPDGAGSKLAGAASSREGLHHLCYGTDDIEAACDDLRSKGMTLVSRPVAAVAFGGRRIAWLMGKDRMLVELLEERQQPVGL